MAHTEIEDELDVEIQEDEAPFFAGQTKRTLDLSPIKIVKAPDGSLNRAALASASLAKAGEVPSWIQSTFNKATTFEEIMSLRIQDQRKSLPLYKLRDPLLKAINEVCILLSHFTNNL